MQSNGEILSLTLSIHGKKCSFYGFSSILYWYIGKNDYLCSAIMADKTPHRASFRMISDAADERMSVSSLHSHTDFNLIRGRRLDQIGSIDITVPYLMENLHIMFLRQGNVTISANLMRHEITAGTLVVLGPGTIYQIEGYTSDLVSDILVIKSSFFDGSSPYQLPALLSDASTFFLAPLDDKRTEAFMQLLDSLATISVTDIPAVIHHLLAAVISFIVHLRPADTAQSSGNRQQDNLARFLRLVSQNCRRERHLSFYADRMALTQDHLSKIVRQASGITAKEWIERAVLLEAKVLLKHTDRSVLNISETLHFPADSFFCKYFKRLTGMTPLQYRKF